MHKIVLASQSPRRKHLLEAAELSFDIIIADIDETPPTNIPAEKVPEHLAQQKTVAIEAQVHDAIIIAADTIVLVDNKILGKPANEQEAIATLEALSGRSHKVITGVCMQKGAKSISFSATTEVFFRELQRSEIEHYVAKYQPYDKAGAYAIQEWIGMIGIEKIVGDYYNVMGLPIGDVVKYLNSDCWD